MHIGAHSNITSKIRAHTHTHAHTCAIVPRCSNTRFLRKVFCVSIHACRCYRYVNHKSKCASKEVLAMWKDPSQRSIAASVYMNICVSIAQIWDLHFTPAIYITFNWYFCSWLRFQAEGDGSEGGWWLQEGRDVSEAVPIAGDCSWQGRGLGHKGVPNGVQKVE